MKRMHMVAKKPFRYGTRRLRAGDAFEPTRAEARVLQAVGLAAEAQSQTLQARDAPVGTILRRKAIPDGQEDGWAKYKPGPLDVASDNAEPDIEALRAEYADLTGKKPHHLWKAPRLQAEIAAAKVEGEADAAGE